MNEPRSTPHPNIMNQWNVAGLLTLARNSLESRFGSRHELVLSCVEPKHLSTRTPLAIDLTTYQYSPWPVTEWLQHQSLEITSIGEAVRIPSAAAWHQNVMLWQEQNLSRNVENRKKLLRMQKKEKNNKNENNLKAILSGRGQNLYCYCYIRRLNREKGMSANLVSCPLN